MQHTASSIEIINETFLNSLSYKNLQNSGTANLLGLATLQVLWSHMARGYQTGPGTGIRELRSYSSAPLPHPGSQAALVLTALFILLLPPFLVHIYICQSWFISFQTVQPTQHLGVEVCLVLPYLMTFELNSSCGYLVMFSLTTINEDLCLLFSKLLSDKQHHIMALTMI